ncbi:MAG: glycosyltransferase family 4 protein, partial [Propionibacteriaceae bacterium]|nr:glycosyltransferase family 4 protein [Propionibacteriaceae bacterium]
GRQTRQKGLPYLLRALDGLPDDVQVVLTAGAPDTPEIAAEVASLVEALRRNRSRVVLIDRMVPQADLAAILTAATLFLCPSIYEPLGIVNLEAMACETAVVASAVGGIPEVVRDQTTGLLVPYDPAQAGDPAYVEDFEAAFAQSVNALLRDPARARAMGEAGRRRCIDHFDWAKIARQTVDVYEQAITAHLSR